MATECVWSWPMYYPQWPTQTQDYSVATPVGCICPPTSEQTCENPTCPRKNPFKQDRIP